LGQVNVTASHKAAGRGKGGASTEATAEPLVIAAPAFAEQTRPCTVGNGTTPVPAVCHRTPVRACHERSKLVLKPLFARGRIDG